MQEPANNVSALSLIYSVLERVLVTSHCSNRHIITLKQESEDQFFQSRFSPPGLEGLLLPDDGLQTAFSFKMTLWLMSTLEKAIVSGSLHLRSWYNFSLRWFMNFFSIRFLWYFKNQFGFSLSTKWTSQCVIQSGVNLHSYNIKWPLNRTEKMGKDKKQSPRRHTISKRTNGNICTNKGDILRPSIQNSTGSQVRLPCIQTLALSLLTYHGS